MDTIKLVLDGLIPISVNEAYYKNRKLTNKARLFRFNVLNSLLSYKALIKNFTKMFNPLEHCLVVSYSFTIPKDIYFTKKGNISIRTKDLDNCIKILQDSLFNKKYNTTKWLNSRKGYEKSLYKPFKEIQNMVIDDINIQRFTAKKIPGKKYSITIEIHIKSLSMISL